MLPGDDRGQQVMAIAPGHAVLTDGTQPLVDAEYRGTADVQVQQGGPVLYRQFQQLDQRIGHGGRLTGTLGQPLQG